MHAAFEHERLLPPRHAAAARSQPLPLMPVKRVCLSGVGTLIPFDARCAVRAARSRYGARMSRRRHDAQRRACAGEAERAR